MKFKQFLHITEPDNFLRGNYSSCFSLFDHQCNYQGWVVCGPIEFDMDINTQQVLDVALEELEKKLDAARTLLKVLENQKADMLFLEAPADDQPNLFDHPANLPHDETTAYGIKDGLTGELRDPPEHFSTRNQ